MDNTIAAVAQKVSPSIAPTTDKAPGTLGKEDFLRLLIAQLQKQDPLNPQDPTEFTAQLAQFSSLEQLTNINENLGNLDLLGDQNAQILAMNTIGKRAKLSGDALTVTSGQATPVNFTLPGDSQSTLMDVYDSGGRMVAQIDLGALAAGSHQAQWNVLDAQGRTAADGGYTFKVTASDSAGEAISVDTQFSGIVSGVRFENGQTLLQIGGSTYTLQEVLALELAS